MEAKEGRSLHDELTACRKELFTLKMNLLAGQVKDNSQFKKLRRKIARTLTELRAQNVETAQQDAAQ